MSNHPDEDVATKVTKTITIARREYDVLLAIPGKLMAQTMEWILTSLGVCPRIRVALEMIIEMR